LFARRSELPTFPSLFVLSRELAYPRFLAGDILPASISPVHIRDRFSTPHPGDVVASERRKRISHAHDCRHEPEGGRRQNDDEREPGGGAGPHRAPRLPRRSFAGTKKLAETRRLVAENLWVVPSNLDLAATEMELADVTGRELLLRGALEESARADGYDYLVIDCPPSLGILTVNALTAVREVFIPLQPHFFALQGLSKLLETTALVTRRLNRALRVTGIVLCLYETGTRLAADITDDLTAFLDRSDSNAPWAGAQIFQSRIRRNIKLAEAPSFGQSIFDYAPQCPGALDYAALVSEVLMAETAAGEPAGTAHAA